MRWPCRSVRPSASESYPRASSRETWPVLPSDEEKAHGASPFGSGLISEAAAHVVVLQSSRAQRVATTSDLWHRTHARRLRGSDLLALACLMCARVAYFFT